MTTIRSAGDADCQAIAEIYNYYIRNTVITFEEQEITSLDILHRIAEVHSYGLPWLVSESDGKLCGYAYATRWNKRAAYRNSAEFSIYLAQQHVGKGMGTLLCKTLFALLREKQIHVIIGGITLPNAASVALHEKFGMKKVAHFEQVGYKFGQWLDVGYWQTTLTEKHD